MAPEAIKSHTPSTANQPAEYKVRPHPLPPGTQCQPITSSDSYVADQQKDGRVVSWLHPLQSHLQAPAVRKVLKTFSV